MNEKQYSFTKKIIIQVVICFFILTTCIYGRGIIDQTYDQIYETYIDLKNNSVTGEKITGLVAKGKGWFVDIREILEAKSSEPMTWDDWMDQIEEFLYKTKDQLENTSI